MFDMKPKNINIMAVILFTFVLSWVLPECYHIVSDKAESYPVCFYSSIAQRFCYFDFPNDKLIRKDVEGNVYTEAQFDSLLPLVYSRQLMCEGKLPSSIRGVPIDMQTIQKEDFSYRYRPDNFYRPSIKLYPLFESMPKRLDLYMPDEFFRVNDRIEFINAESNCINEERSDYYTRRFIKEGFRFPAREVSGIPTTRKMHDEGYFITDSNYSVFHLKMVNGKMYFRNTGISPELKVKHIEAVDYLHRRFYAFLFDSKGQLYTISSNNYKLEKLGIPPIDTEQTSISIFANMMYWNVSIIKNGKKISYALDAKTKKMVDFIEQDAYHVNKNKVSSIFPFSLTFTSSKDKYVYPRIKLGNINLLFVNVFFALLYLIVMYLSKRSYKLHYIIWIILSGFLGLIPVLLLNKSNKK